MIIVDFKVITAVDDCIASIFFPAGEVLDDFFMNELFDGDEGNFVGSGLKFIYTY